jgi:glycosyltransferase involved in cell wall biosynthesis/acetyltransferase-like isoleucine patch superfamily enzyme
MPSYNHAQYVREALMSLAAQTYPNIELIIIDDGSRDETPRIIEETVAEFTRDMRVDFRRQENAGLCTTLNRALELAQGEFVQFMASDDAYLPEKTARSIAALRAAKADVAAVYCDGYIMDEKSRRRGVFSDKHRVPMGKDLHRELLIANWIPAMGILYRREVVTALGGFDAKLWFEDWDFLLRLTQTHRVARIPDKLFLYRVHSASMTRDKELMEKTTEALAQKHPDMAKFRRFKEDLRRNPVAGLIRHYGDIDLGFRMLARRIFTNKGFQGERYSAAVLQLTRSIVGTATAKIRAGLYRLGGFQLGRRSIVRGRLRSLGNLRNLAIGDEVTFEGDAEFILPRGLGQGRVVIGNGTVIAHGALFHCMAGELVIGPSCYVGRNAVLQSNGDLYIGPWTLIAANAGLYANNHVASGSDLPIWTQGNRFVGITVGQDCWVGHGAVIVDGATLGDRCIVGPNQVVRGVHEIGSRLL